MSTSWFPVPLAAALLVTGLSAQAQDSHQVRPVAAPDYGKIGVALNRDKDGQVVSVGWKDRVVPLPAPVKDCDIGLTGDSKTLAILAGGVRSSLDILVAWGADNVRRFDTGGKRLPESAPKARGSWPWIDGEVILYAFEKDRKLEFRVQSPTGSAARQVSLKDDPWQVTSDPDQGFVLVRFPVSKERVEVLHPLAPRLTLMNGTLEFGVVENKQVGRALLHLRNDGKRPLRARLACDKSAFSLAGADSLTLKPGQAQHVVVLFKPVRAGAAQARLRVQANGAFPELWATLRGTGREKVVAPDPTTVNEAGSVKHKKVAGGSKPSSQPVPSPPPALPRLAKLIMYPTGSGRTLVIGRLQGPLPPGQVLHVGGGRVSRPAALDVAGRFSVEIQSVPKAMTRFEIRDGAGRTSKPLHGKNVPAALSISTSEVVARGLPGRRFLLLMLPRDSNQELQSWSSKFDCHGSWQVELRQLPAVPDTDLALLYLDDRGSVAAARRPVPRQ